jgi:hypothetical protein
VQRQAAPKDAEGGSPSSSVGTASQAFEELTSPITLLGALQHAVLFSAAEPYHPGCDLSPPRRRHRAATVIADTTATRIAISSGSWADIRNSTCFRTESPTSIASGERAEVGRYRSRASVNDWRPSHARNLSSLYFGRKQSRSGGHPAVGRIASSHLTVERQLIPRLSRVFSCSNAIRRWASSCFTPRNGCASGGRSGR